MILGPYLCRVSPRTCRLRRDGYEKPELESLPFDRIIWQGFAETQLAVIANRG